MSRCFSHSNVFPRLFARFGSASYTCAYCFAHSTCCLLALSSSSRPPASAMVQFGGTGPTGSYDRADDIASLSISWYTL
ncbi:hypothetical protein MA16_Dca015545 [Dendrobium catenatum]|uniref:Uncharacterized protein n=1 Tax=Dendrobium catenatum TaxID=906689 RepID=A0A2I0WKP9_9ASPA|nr:hypothetical protein MA16_Dca015545 [Dendrobium catenatum]